MFARLTRLFALLVLVGVGALGTWYVLRDTPAKEMTRLRKAYERAWEGTPRDVAEAKRINERLLELAPNNPYDLLVKAGLLETEGGPENLREALAIYDDVLQRGVELSPEAGLRKARLCRRLSRFAEATAALYSVADVALFRALQEFGEVALAQMNAAAGAAYYSAARGAAGSDDERADASLGLARAYGMLVSQTGRSSTQPDVARDVLVADYRAKALAALADVRSFLTSNRPPVDQTIPRLLRLAVVLEMSANLVSTDPSADPKASPYWDGVSLVKQKAEDWRAANEDGYPQVQIRIGSLKLLSAELEKDKLAEGLAEGFRAEAEKDFLNALGLSPENARALLRESTPAEDPFKPNAEPASPDRDDPGNGYRDRLYRVAQIYLGTSEYQRLLQDEGDLMLSRRLSDAMEGPPRSARGFAYLAGVAHLKRLGMDETDSGDLADAKRLFGVFLANTPREQVPIACLEVAAAVLGQRPGDPLFFEYIDKFDESGGGALVALPYRLNLLDAAGKNAELAEEAGKRFDAVLLRAHEAAKEPADRLAYMNIVYRVRELDDTIALAEEASRRYPEEWGFRAVLAYLLAEKAKRLEGDESTDAQDACVRSYTRALENLVALLIHTPTRSRDLLERSSEVMRRLEALRAKTSLQDVLKEFYPGASDSSLADLSGGLQSFLLGNPGATIERIKTIEEVEKGTQGGGTAQFQPFLAYLKGNAHVGFAAELLRQASSSTSPDARKAKADLAFREIDSAREAFESGAEFLPCKVELLNLRLQKLSQGEDVPDDLMKELESISKQDEVAQRGALILARALRRRFLLGYADDKVQNSALASLLAKERAALRSAIGRDPTYIQPYLKLAETYVLRPTVAPEGVERDLFSPDYKKAANVLKIAPELTVEALSAIASYLDAAGEPQSATPYVEQRAVLDPTVEAFLALAMNYSKAKDPAWPVLVGDHEGSEESASKGLPAARREVVAAMRERFEQRLPEYEGLSFMCRALRLMTSEAGTTVEARKKDLRRQIIDLSDQAIAKFEEKRLPVPVMVLNNLAWYLGEDPDDTTARARGLELATQALERAGGPGQSPDVHDTYAWLLHRNGRSVQAEAVLRELIAEVDTPTYRYHLAQVLFALKNYNDALAEVQKALSSGKPFPEQADARRLEREIQHERG